MSPRWLVLLAAFFDVVLLWPILSSIDLVPGQYRRAYFEPRDGRAELVFDRQSSGGYVTEVEPDRSGDLFVPAGRTIGIPLEDGVEIGLRTTAQDRAPYLVVGAEVDREKDTTAPSTLFSEPVVFVARDRMLAGEPWDLNRPWTTDREWLHELATHCGLASSTSTTVRLDRGEVAVRLGECSGRTAVSTTSSRTPMLVVVSGLNDVTVTRSPSGWDMSREVNWPLIGLATARIGLLSVAIGIGPTIVTDATLLLASLYARPVTILTWYAVIVFALPIGMGRLVARLAPASASFGWIAGGAVLGAELLAIVAFVRVFDLGAFGNERITRAGDGECSIVGYSTVRGDSLRYGTGGIAERLNDRCAPCMNRTSRFSKEAQTLHWIRDVVCDPAFPSPPAGEVVFVGGANDDIFYQSNGVWLRLASWVGLLQMMVSPPATSDLQSLFERANERAVLTLDDQAADIRAITGCALKQNRRFWFLHDFLVGDLDRGRSPSRQATFERRRTEVRRAGGQFIDLLEEFRDSVGVAWLNDLIHPSAVGQERIAALLCDRISHAEVHGN